MSVQGCGHAMAGRRGGWGGVWGEVMLEFTAFTPTYRPAAALVLAAQARLNWQVLRVQVSAVA